MQIYFGNQRINFKLGNTAVVCHVFQESTKLLTSDNNFLLDNDGLQLTTMDT